MHKIPPLKIRTLWVWHVQKYPLFNDKNITKIQNCGQIFDFCSSFLSSGVGHVRKPWRRSLVELATGVHDQVSTEAPGWHQNARLSPLASRHKPWPHTIRPPRYPRPDLSLSPTQRLWELVRASVHSHIFYACSELLDESSVISFLHLLFLLHFQQRKLQRLQ